ncbi:hypothetical protein SISNIDRAFT_455905 [Sistotremastrum niveocremeum HHB9708]|uniref:Uncharacterized protein n=1 Tax=Sistotremastrum niveocremeum HHB9708 TaxID=1314777 RepID=A0A164T7J6_9AGAM|nr:hypothetical protein SISNIDRAFT_455905 [Sistotremastrum niveocremeum HHB9708]
MTSKSIDSLADSTKQLSMSSPRESRLTTPVETPTMPVEGASPPLGSQDPTSSKSPSFIASEDAEAEAIKQAKIDSILARLEENPELRHMAVMIKEDPSFREEVLQLMDRASKFLEEEGLEDDDDDEEDEEEEEEEGIIHESEERPLPGSSGKVAEA